MEIPSHLPPPPPPPIRYSYLSSPSLCAVSLDGCPTNVCTLHVGCLPPQTPSIPAGALGPPPLWSAAGQGKWCVCVCVRTRARACVSVCLCVSCLCLTLTRGLWLTIHVQLQSAIARLHCFHPTTGHLHMITTHLLPKSHCAIIVTCRG